MGYEIIYDKKFVMTSRGYIPFILSGSSNCTMFVGNKEILERSWFVYNDKLMFCTKENLMDFAESLSHTDYELFKEGNRWVEGKDICNWFKNAINSSYRINDLLKVNKGRSICCYVWMTNDTDYCSKTLFKAFVHTDEELFDWYDKHYDYIEDGWTSHISIGFNGYEKMKSPGRINGKVIVAYRRGVYLEQFSNCTYILTKDKSKAMVFDGLDDYINKTKSSIIEPYIYTLVKAPNMN